MSFGNAKEVEQSKLKVQNAEFHTKKARAMVLSLLSAKRKGMQQARGFYLLKSNLLGGNHDHDSRSETKAALYDQI